jgi:VWFA-related protein
MSHPAAPFLVPAAVLAMLAAASPLRCQQPPPAARFGESLEVNEALLDVLVTDRDGNVILGLTPADFRVTVDGRPAEVTSATFYSNRRFLDSTPAGRLGIDPAAVPDRRWFVLFFDDQRLKSFDNPALLDRQIRAGRETIAWLRKEMLPGDRVAVAGFNARLRLQQDFTADVDAVVRAVERAVRGEEPPADWPSRRSAPGDSPSLAAALGDPATVARDTGEIHKALTVLARALATVPGRKNLALFTSGFGDLDSAGHYKPDGRYDRPMVEALNAGNVAVYTIDVVPPSTRHTLEGFFTHLAGETGGLPFFDVVQFGLPLERLARETNGYYLVSVKAPAEGEPGYRSVEVSVANPEFKVRSRTGLAPPAAR